MVKIRKMLSDNSNHYNGVNSCEFITIHETDNTSKGAGADNHSRYIDNGSEETWHYSVDDIEIVQSFKDKVQCWHAGDVKGNKNSIGVEMCVNSDSNYRQTVNNTIELVKHLMDKHNIPIENVVQHNYWSGKNCPRILRSGNKGITWSVFKEKVKGNKPTSKKDKVKIDQLVKDTIAGKYGNGEERKRKLGVYYERVQNIINGNVDNSSNHQSIVDIDDLVKRTIRGDFGNGNERKKALGEYYDEVMRKVNDIYS